MNDKVEIGEEWFVKIPSRNGILKVMISEMTSKTIVFDDLEDLTVLINGFALRQSPKPMLRMLINDVEFIEKISSGGTDHDNKS